MRASDSELELLRARRRLDQRLKRHSETASSAALSGLIASRTSLAALTTECSGLVAFVKIAGRSALLPGLYKTGENIRAKARDVESRISAALTKRISAAEIARFSEAAAKISRRLPGVAIEVAVTLLPGDKTTSKPMPGVGIRFQGLKNKTTGRPVDMFSLWWRTDRSVATAFSAYPPAAGYEPMPSKVKTFTADAVIKVIEEEGLCANG